MISGWCGDRSFLGISRKLFDWRSSIILNCVKLVSILCYQYGNMNYLCMRVIAVSTLKHYLKKFPVSKESLLSWYEEVEEASWGSPAELKGQYRSASILSDKRVVFNINGNRFRLIVDIEYRRKLVFVVWFGSHQEYDRIDAKKLNYGKAD